MAKPKGHKRGCKCAICSRAKRGKGSKAKKRGAKKGAHRSPAAAIRHARALLRQAKRGQAAAAKHGDAASWQRFTGAISHAESRIRALK